MRARTKRNPFGPKRDAAVLLKDSCKRLPAPVIRIDRPAPLDLTNEQIDDILFGRQPQR